MFKINNKDRTRSMTCSGVFIVSFEQVNVSWADNIFWEIARSVQNVFGSNAKWCGKKFGSIFPYSKIKLWGSGNK